MTSSANRCSKGDYGVIPATYLRYLWFCGLHHPFNHEETNSRDSVKPRRCHRIQNQWSYAAAVLTSILAVLSLTQYIVYYLRDIATMDFFILVRLINNASEQIQVPLIVLILFGSRRKVGSLLERFSRIGIPIITESSAARLRRKFSVFAPIWLVVCFAVFCGGASFHYWPALRSIEAFTSPASFLGGMHPACFSIIMSFMDGIITFNVDIAPQLFYMLLISALTAGFRNIHRNVKEILLSRDEGAKRSVEVLEQDLNNLQLLKNLTRDLNDSFGFLILLNCIRDMIAVVGLIAVCLQVDGKQGADESDADFAQRVEFRVHQGYWDYTITSITLANAALRIGVCVYCNLSVKQIEDILQRYKVESPSADIREACTRFLSEIDGSTGAISAAGLSNINMDYVAGVMGIWITYAVLVYQTSDGKMQAADTVKLADLRRHTALLLTIVRNQTQFASD